MHKPLHPLLPERTHDDVARQEFVKSLRGHLSERVMPGNYSIYSRRIEPAFQRQHGRAPASREEVRELMLREPYYRFWSSLQRRSQELMWESVIIPTERQWRRLIERARNPADSVAGGTLELDPTLALPRYHAEQDIHIQPGGYHTEWVPEDVSAGAVYEAGVQMYMANAWGAEGAFLGDLLVRFLHKRWPRHSPSRILDMGCTIGNSTLPWARAFPGAEVHAIDVAAPVLRYAHARAEALGVPVHFSQRNAESTGYEAGSFDLVVSHIVLHETSLVAMPKILGESRRLLRPGGLMLHMDIPRGDVPFRQFMHDWESYHNNEGFSRLMTGLDLRQMAIDGGWYPDEVEIARTIPGFSASQKNYTDDDYPYTVVIGQR
jgi:SAM-dependent methyltransferase